MEDLIVQDPRSWDSPVSEADHALLSDDRGAPVMSGGAWLTQDPVLPGRTGLLTQVSADDNDVEPRTLPCSALASCAGKGEGRGVSRGLLCSQ